MQKIIETRIGRSLLIGLGGLLITAALFISNESIERTLVSNPSHSLSWGPTLFRLLLVLHGIVLLIVFVQSGKKVRSSLMLSSLDTKITNRSWLALMFMSVVALGLRLWHLNSDLWFDELLTLLNYVRLPIGEILTRLPDQNNHILFSLLSHLSVQALGESAGAVRVPSVLFGVLSLWALFFLGRRIIGTRESLLAVALMTVSYHHIWFSQNARGYMALLFFSMLATWLWIEALSRQSWSWWISYSIAVTGGMLSHMTMAFVVAAHVLVYLIVLSTKAGRQDLKGFEWRAFGAWALCISLTLQVYALALPEFLRIGLHEVSLESEWTNPWWMVAETVRNLRLGFVGVVGLVIGGALLVIGWFRIAKSEWAKAAVLLVPALLAGGTMLALGHNLWPRFFFFCMGFALLIVIHGAMNVPRLLLPLLPNRHASAQLGYRAGLTLALIMIAGSITMLPRNYAYPKQDYSGARDYVESHRGSDDQVVAVGLAAIAYRQYFAPAWATAQTQEELENARHGNGKNIWLIYTLPVQVKAYRPDVWQVIQDDFEIVKVFPGTLGGGEVFVCRARHTT